HKKFTTNIYLFVFCFTAGSFADKIGPTDKDANILRKETDNVTLKCSYETNSNNTYLYWYQQYPNSTPQFLLYKGARSYSGANTPADTRLESNTSRDSTELTIRGLKLSDSALYHCALKVGDTLIQSENVTLSCRYKTSAKNNYVHWYRQHRKSKPEFLLIILQSGTLASDKPARMDAKIRKDEVDLIISSAAVSDSALYYCALQPTVTGNPAALYKNLHTGFKFLFSMTGDSMADSIETLFTHKVVDEGENVTLSCKYKPTYSTGTIYLHWYIQYPQFKPKFLLHISQSGDLSPDKPSGMTAEVNDGDNKQVDLIISSAAVSDSALYYCALRPTVTGNPAAVYKNLDSVLMCGKYSYYVLFSMTGDSMADSVEPFFTHRAVNEGDDVTLSCKYKTSATTPYLHWYRKHPKSKPVFLLYINLYGSKTNPMPTRLDVKIDKTNKEVDLIISSAAVSDSDLYNCALVPTVTGNPAALYKNL
ncbi:hypothetical protein C0J45_23483, partial [Silurus meridionalis]